MKKLINKPFLLYTIISAIFVLVIAIPLIIKGGLFVDAMSQHLLFMSDYIDAIKDLFSGNGLQLFRFDIGMGADVIVSYAYYSLFDPINIIALIIPTSLIEVSYYVILLLRLYLSGIFIIFLAKRLNIKKPTSLVILAVFYCFNSCTIYSALRHPMFLNITMLLPVACYGFEKIKDNETPYIFIITICYSLISQFYCFAYLTLGIELYIILRLIEKHKNFKIILKQFLKTNLFYLVGILLASFVFIPQIMTLFDSSRTVSKGFIMYNAKYYLGLISSFVIPIVSTHYTATIGNFAVFIIILGYILSNKKKSWSLYLIISTIFLSFSIFGYLFNICSYVNNRWSFIILLPASLIIGEVLEDENIIKVSSYEKMGKIILSLLLLIIVFALSLLTNLIRIQLIKTLLNILLIALFIWQTSVILRLQNLIFLKKIITWVLDKKRLAYLILILSFISTICVTVFSSIKFYTKESFDSYDEGEIKTAFEDDPDFYRVEQGMYCLGRSSLSNDGVYYHYPSTSFYNTMATSTISEMLNYFDIPNLNYGTGYNGFDNRIITNALSSTKYLLISSSEVKTVPYGYTYLKTIKTPKIYDKDYHTGGKIEHTGEKTELEDTLIYQNDNYISFGYVYHDYYTLAELENLNGLEKEYASLYGVILEKETSHLNKISLPDMHIKTKHNFVEEDYFIDNEELIYEITHTDGNIYLSCEGLVLEEKSLLTYQVYEDNDLLFSTTFEYYPYGANFYYENNSITNLGYFDDGTYTIKIKPSITTLQLEEVILYEDNLTNISPKIANLKEETLTNISFNNNGFTGNIETSGGLLLVSLPYGKGFKAYVDGKETEILQANIGYMGIVLDEGSHQIEFIYHTNGLKLGSIISMVSLSGLLISSIVLVIKKRNKKLHL